VNATSTIALGIALVAAVATRGPEPDQSQTAPSPSAAQANPAPADAPPDIGVGDVPGGIPGGQNGHVIDWILNSAPVVKPRVVTPQRIRVSAGVSQRLLVKRVNPDYPSDARQGRIQGQVVLQILITKAGDVATVELVLGHLLLAPAAMDAVKQWKYKPFFLQGVPLEVDTEVLVSFTL
jgi:periplasmic protein TonB